MRYSAAIVSVFLFGMRAVHAQDLGTQEAYPPLTDNSLVNHQPWPCSQLQDPCSYQVFTPSGTDQSAIIQTALNNSAVLPVMLVGGGANNPFIVCTELQVPGNGIFVMENGLHWDSYRSVGPATFLQCPSGNNFNGTAYVGIAGDYAYLRGISVDDNYGHQATITAHIDNGSGAAGNTLTVTATDGKTKLGFGQIVTDGSVHVADVTHITNQISGTTGGVGTYGVDQTQLVVSESMNALLTGIEHLNNASFSTLERPYAVRMTGTGYNVIANGNMSGGQGFSGDIIRPMIRNSGFFGYNHRYGVEVNQLTCCSSGPGYASDMDFDFVNTTSNTFGSMVLNGTTGTLTQFRTEFDGYGISALNAGPLLIIGFLMDNNNGVSCGNLKNTQMKIIGGFGFIRSGNSSTTCFELSGSTSFVLRSFENDLQYPFQVDAGFTGNTSIEMTGVKAYPSTLTATTVEPTLINANIAGWTTIPISTATFTPDFSFGQRQFIISLSHSACPCTLANPAWTIPGMTLTFKIVQSASGSDLISTYGTNYLPSTKPTLSSVPGAVDIIPAITLDNGTIAFGSEVANVH